MKTILAAFLASMALTATAFAQSLSVVPTSSMVQIGDDVVVSIDASGLGDGIAPSVGVFDIDLAFDPGLLQFTSADYGTGLDVLGLGSIRTTTEGVGSINLFELSLDSADDLNGLQSGAFAFATVTFRALTAGSSPLSLTVNAVGDGDGAALLFAVTNGQVTVSAVPELPIWALFGTALAGLALRRSACGGLDRIS